MSLGGGGSGKLDATVPKMFCSMIHASVLMIDPKRGSAEDEKNTKDYHDPFLSVDPVSYTHLTLPTILLV